MMTPIVIDCVRTIPIQLQGPSLIPAQPRVSQYKFLGVRCHEGRILMWIEAITSFQHIVRFKFEANRVPFNSVGRPKHQKVMFNALEQDMFIGQNAVSHSATSFSHPWSRKNTRVWLSWVTPWSMVQWMTGVTWSTSSDTSSRSLKSMHVSTQCCWQSHRLTHFKIGASSPTWCLKPSVCQVCSFNLRPCSVCMQEAWRLAWCSMWAMVWAVPVLSTKATVFAMQPRGLTLVAAMSQLTSCNY